jgi:hypothetical protein
MSDATSVQRVMLGSNFHAGFMLIPRLTYNNIPSARFKDQIRISHEPATGALPRSRGFNGATTTCYVLGVNGGHNRAV